MKVKFSTGSGEWYYETEIPNQEIDTIRAMNKPDVVSRAKPAASKALSKRPAARVINSVAERMRDNSRAYHKKYSECLRLGMHADQCKSEARAAARVAERKREHSRAYHRKYVECLGLGMDADQSKSEARAAAREAMANQ